LWSSGCEHVPKVPPKLALQGKAKAMSDFSEKSEACEMTARKTPQIHYLRAEIGNKIIQKMVRKTFCQLANILVAWMVSLEHLALLF